MKEIFLSDQKIEALEDATEGVFTIDPWELPESVREGRE